jgi:hypothetical protein
MNLSIISFFCLGRQKPTTKGALGLSARANKSIYSLAINLINPVGGWVLLMH